MIQAIIPILFAMMWTPLDMNPWTTLRRQKRQRGNVRKSLAKRQQND
ncbi:hypothetical protein [Bacteroides heparinolyticus]